MPDRHCAGMRVTPRARAASTTSSPSAACATAPSPRSPGRRCGLGALACSALLLHCRLRVSEGCLKDAAGWTATVRWCHACWCMSTQVETGSAITWKYPSCILKGDGSVGEFYSVALTNNAQQADTGRQRFSADACRGVHLSEHPAGCSPASKCVSL